MRTGSDGDTTKLNTLSAFSASSRELHRARACCAALTVNGVERYRCADRPASTSTGLLPTGRPPTLERHRSGPSTGRSVRLVTPAVTATRSWFGERRARERHAVTLTFGSSAAPLNGHRRQRRAARQPRAFFAAPAAALEVADQDDLAPRQRRLGEDAAGHLQRGRVPRRGRRRASPRRHRAGQRDPARRVDRSCDVRARARTARPMPRSDGARAWRSASRAAACARSQRSPYPCCSCCRAARPLRARRADRRRRVAGAARNGRANARMISASAASRTTSSSQL